MSSSSSRPPRARAGRKGSGGPSEQSPILLPTSSSPSPPPLNGFSLTPDQPEPFQDDTSHPLPPKPPKAKDGQRDKDRHPTPPTKADKLLAKSKKPTASNAASSASPAPSSPSSDPPHALPSSNGSSKRSDLAPLTSLKRKTSSSPSPLPAAKSLKPSSPSSSSSLSSSIPSKPTPSSSSSSSSHLKPTPPLPPSTFEVYSPLFDPLTGETLFCICRRANDGEAMICCDVCEEWYHLRCIGLTSHEVARIEHFVCGRCKLDAVKGREENRRRKRVEEERKAKAAAATGEKRVRRRDKGGGGGGGVDGEREGRLEDLDLGDGTGKWIKKDAGVDSESDDDELVYMTSDDDDIQPLLKAEAAAIKAEPAVKHENDAAARSARPSSPPLLTSSFRAHHLKQPRTLPHNPSFARPDHRLHPLIHHTARVRPPLYPPTTLLHQLSYATSSALHGLYRHPFYQLQYGAEHSVQDEPNRILRAVHRLAQRWASLQAEYEDEEEKRHLQLAGEEWRVHQLILAYHMPASTTLTPDDDSFSPQQTPLDLLLSSALPLGLGHPRFLHDTQLVVTSTNEHPPDAQHSQAHTPASSSSSSSLSSHAGQPSRPSFRYSSQRKHAADCVVIESVYCMGCEGYIPTADYVAHLEDCCVGPMTTPDQRVTVLLPYEEEMEDEVRPSPMSSRHWTAEEERQYDALLQSAAAASTMQSEKLAGMEGRLSGMPPLDKQPPHPTKNGTLHPLQPTHALHQGMHHLIAPPFVSHAALSQPLPGAQSAVVARSLPAAEVDSELPPPPLSLLPSPAYVTRYHRFLNPAMFPSLLCGYPLLCGLPSSPSYTHCRELRMHCPDHAGWEEQWRLQRRRRRGLLVSRMVAIRDDIAALSAFLHARMHTSDALPPLTASLPDKRQLSGDGAAQAQVDDVLCVISDVDSADDVELSADDADGDALEQRGGHKRREGRATSLSSSSDSARSSSSPLLSASLLSGSLMSSAKKEKDRERVRERERLNKQRQRERAKAREREKEARAREKERSKEKKRERKRKKEEKERGKKERKKEKEKERDRGRERKKRQNGGGGGSHAQSASRSRRDDSSSDGDESSSSSDSVLSDAASSSSDHHHA